MIPENAISRVKSGLQDILPHFNYEDLKMKSKQILYFRAVKNGKTERFAAFSAHEAKKQAEKTLGKPLADFYQVYPLGVAR
jgi:hypothetical protein